MMLSVIERQHPLRGITEACIRDVYEQVFGAREFSLPRTLIAKIDENGQLLCAAGLRTASDGFFSEAYLDSTIESVLARRTRAFVDRDSIFEITTLVSRDVQLSPAFLYELAALGKSAGFRWSFFTATSRLRKLLRALEIPLHLLTPADPRRVPDSRPWGNYYMHSPKVCAVGDQWLVGGTDRQ